MLESLSNKVTGLKPGIFTGMHIQAYSYKHFHLSMCVYIDIYIGLAMLYYGDKYRKMKVLENFFFFVFVFII